MSPKETPIPSRTPSPSTDMTYAIRPSRRVRRSGFGYEDPDQGFLPPSLLVGCSRSQMEFSLCLVFLAGSLAFALVHGVLWLLVRMLRRREFAVRRAALKVGLDARGTLRVAHRASRHGPPSRALLLRAWDMRETLEGKLLLGSLLGDADAHVDHSYIRGDGGEIVGRRGGVRRWLEAVCPELSRHYKTLMRHKALADKFRLACGLSDPDGAEDLLDIPVPEHAKDSRPAQRATEARKHAVALLAKHHTAHALDEVLWSELGLPRNRRRPKRQVA